MSLSPWTLLDIWERGLAQPVAWRALLLLAAATPDTPLDELAALSVGQRDSHLLSLREHLFATLNMLVGLWPLTAIVLFAAGLLIMAGNNGAP